MKFSGFVYYVKDYCCANFRNQQSFFNVLKIELKNRDFRKSLYFYIVDSGKKKEKKELRLGAGIILNQELTYSRHWGKWAAGACQRPDIRMYSGIDAFAVNCVLYLIVCRSR